MNTSSEIKTISLEDFKKIDINKILYVQLDTGEILMVDHSINNNMIKTNYKEKNEKKGEKEKKEKKREKAKKKEKKKDKDKSKKYTLPKKYFKKISKLKKSKSNERIKKRSSNIINGWISISDLDIEKKMKFYDNIPKRAKYWENESYDSTRSFFHEKRIKKQNIFNNYKQFQDYNYVDFPKETSSEEEYDQINQFYNNMNRKINDNIQMNQFMNPNYIYQLALGPLYSQYLSSQNSQNYNNNVQWNEYLQNNYPTNQNYYDYYKEQMTPYYYDNYQNDFYEYKNTNANTQQKEITKNK
jgi:hypothetical protein